MSKIDIIIVNWNGGEYLQKCLTSLERIQGNLVSKIVLVDNASWDGSADNLEKFNLPLEIVRNKKNLGFARACNQGASRGEAEYMLFLNPDVILYPGNLELVVSWMNKHSRVGVCGIKLIDEKNRIQKTCAYFPTPLRIVFQEFGINKIKALRDTGVHMNDWDHQSSREVDHVIGAFFCTRRKVFHKLNGFDERFFVYYEDIDFSYRTHLAGYKIMYFSETSAFHYGGGTTEGIKGKRLAYSLSSKLKYAYKHFSFLESVFLLISFSMIVPLMRTIYGIVKLDFPSILKTITGTWYLWGMVVRDLGFDSK